MGDRGCFRTKEDTRARVRYYGVRSIELFANGLFKRSWMGFVGTKYLWSLGRLFPYFCFWRVTLVAKMRCSQNKEEKPMLEDENKDCIIVKMKTRKGYDYMISTGILR